jgi:hypothetical protein
VQHGEPEADGQQRAADRQHRDDDAHPAHREGRLHQHRARDVGQDGQLELGRLHQAQQRRRREHAERPGAGLHHSGGALGEGVAQAQQAARDAGEGELGGHAPPEAALSRGHREGDGDHARRQRQQGRAGGERAGLEGRVRRQQRGPREQRDHADELDASHALAEQPHAAADGEEGVDPAQPLEHREVHPRQRLEPHQRAGEAHEPAEQPAGIPEERPEEGAGAPRQLRQRHARRALRHALLLHHAARGLEGAGGDEQRARVHGGGL